MNILKFTGVFVTLLCIPFVSQAKTAISCPAEIQSVEKLSAVPAGFSVFTADSNQYLEKVTFFSGKPEENASLAPDETSKNSMIFSFAAGDSIYLSCGYHQSKLELYKKLPDNLKKCVVELDGTIQGSFGAVPKAVVCE